MFVIAATIVLFVAVARGRREFVSLSNAMTVVSCVVCTSLLIL